jgi:undecaprenyl diphosphate synthase
LEHKIPQHVAIVMDGNGRWAEQRNMPRMEGHRRGVEAAKNAIRFCLDRHIPVLSLFAFGCENWARPKEEVDFLMQLMLDGLLREMQTLHQHGVSLRFLGDRTPLPSSLVEQMAVAERLTAHPKQLQVNIAVNYSGRWDIMQAMRIILARVSSGELDETTIDEAVFQQALSTYGLPDPDLFIRTSGEQRISNFFLWQFAYTEFYFVPECWPDFDATAFDVALSFFMTRERRYGRTSQQLKGEAC